MYKIWLKYILMRHWLDKTVTDFCFQTKICIVSICSLQFHKLIRNLHDQWEECMTGLICWGGPEQGAVAGSLWTFFPHNQTSYLLCSMYLYRRVQIKDPIIYECYGEFIAPGIKISLSLFCVFCGKKQRLSVGTDRLPNPCDHVIIINNHNMFL